MRRYICALASVMLQASYLLLVERTGAEKGIGVAELLMYNALLSLPFILAVSPCDFIEPIGCILAVLAPGLKMHIGQYRRRPTAEPAISPLAVRHATCACGAAATRHVNDAAALPVAHPPPRCPKRRRCQQVLLVHCAEAATVCRRHMLKKPA